MTELGSVPELVRVIAEEVDRVSLGDVDTDSVTADSLLWDTHLDTPNIGLTSLQFIELIYWIEQRTGCRLPDGLEPAMFRTVGDLAQRLLGQPHTR